MEKLNSSVIFKNVSFAYESEKNIFENISLALPTGVVSLIGQNGTGKSTFLLLAGGRLIPEGGSILINGIDTRKLKSEEEKNKHVSFIYQNMEFETDDNIGNLLSFIYENGFHIDKNPRLLKKIINTLDLSELLQKTPQVLSKGEMQRTVIAFSLLYGSEIIMMDEPVFALENDRKEIVLSYLNEFARQFNISIYYSIHEIDLSKKYSDQVMLFTKNREIICGPTKELLEKKNIEKIYQVPIDMLHKREDLFRDHLLKDNIENLKGLNTKVYE